jgi:Fur family ferric uptake transcriptional regulator
MDAQSPPKDKPIGMTSIEQLCLEKGLKMTGPRRVIAKVLSSASNHPDAEEVHKRASKVDPRISLATVYRTLRLFEEQGILARRDFGDGRSRYEAEASRHHHDHLIDLHSGRVIEFESEEIEALQAKLARRLGYRLVNHRLELYGVPLRKAK